MARSTGADITCRCTYCACPNKANPASVGGMCWCCQQAIHKPRVRVARKAVAR